MAHPTSGPEGSSDTQSATSRTGFQSVPFDKEMSSRTRGSYEGTTEKRNQGRACDLEGGPGSKGTLATVRIREVVINGLVIRRVPSGRLRVFWPTYKRCSGGYLDVIRVSRTLRSRADAEVIAAYRKANRARAKEERKR